jgi:hypothetical protein
VELRRAENRERDCERDEQPPGEGLSARASTRGKPAPKGGRAGRCIADDLGCIDLAPELLDRQR